MLANCFMVSFVKALLTRTTVAQSHYVYVIFVVGGGVGKS